MPYIVDIFISYAREDEARIQHLACTLEKQGWSVFWDRRIPAGKTWHSYIGQALGTARCVIVAWSRFSIVSNWVIEEADTGKQRDVLVPVLLDPVEPPIGFRSIQAADLADWQPGSPPPRFEQLVQDIRLILGVTPTKPENEQPAEPEAATLSEAKERWRAELVSKAGWVDYERTIRVHLNQSSHLIEFRWSRFSWNKRIVKVDGVTVAGSRGLVSPLPFQLDFHITDGAERYPATVVTDLRKFQLSVGGRLLYSEAA